MCFFLVCRPYSAVQTCVPASHFLSAGQVYLTADPPSPLYIFPSDHAENRGLSYAVLLLDNQNAFDITSYSSGTNYTGERSWSLHPRSSRSAALHASCFFLSSQSFQAPSSPHRHCATRVFCNHCLTQTQSRGSGLHPVPPRLEQLWPPAHSRSRAQAEDTCTPGT